MEFGGLEPCTSNSPDSSRKRNRKRKPAELGESDGLSGKKLKRISALAEAAAKIDPSHLADFFAKPHWHGIGLLGFYTYFNKALSQVSFPWVELFEETPLSMLIDVPLSDIPQPIYKASVNWIKQHPFGDLSHFVSWAIERIIREQHTCGVAAFVALAMVLRTKPDVLTTLLPMLRERIMFQGQDKLPVTVWLMAQASEGDLSVGLYSWAHNLLPLVGNNKCYSLQSVDLILQLVEKILSNPESRTILVNGAVRDGIQLIPPTSFEILVRFTFPASSARVKTTERFEAIYPLLKEVALAPGSREIFGFSLKLAGEGNPVLAKEATEIAIGSLTANADCFKQWDILYKENLEASVVLLKKLVDEWKDHSLKLISTPSDTLTLNRAMNSFRLKNKKAITEREALCSIYKEADKSCKVILGRLSSGSGYLKGITAVTAAGAVVVGAVAGAVATVVIGGATGMEYFQ
ncbi:Transmembrane protein 214 [Arabidopsis suecica]|uniref:Transmembrane protein 214 n=1 Tax=Arabidopsis suecica TaxID=45249 RepID=A0A8T2B8X5_ARASU|nr:Transmembrane protein 214 [Arabidopsis suecica]